jgi:hypothetical protein
MIKLAAASRLPEAFIKMMSRVSAEWKQLGADQTTRKMERIAVVANH